MAAVQAATARAQDRAETVACAANSPATAVVTVTPTAGNDPWPVGVAATVYIAGGEVRPTVSPRVSASSNAPAQADPASVIRVSRAGRRQVSASPIAAATRAAQMLVASRTTVMTWVSVASRCA